VFGRPLQDGPRVGNVTEVESIAALQSLLGLGSPQRKVTAAACDSERPKMLVRPQSSSSTEIANRDSKLPGRLLADLVHELDAMTSGTSMDSAFIRRLSEGA